MSVNQEAPLSEPIIAITPEQVQKLGITGLISTGWFDYLLEQILQPLKSATRQIGAVRLQALTAAIVATAIPGCASVTAGMYRVNVAATIKDAASITSALTVTINYTQNGVVRAYASQTITNGGASASTGFTAPFRADQSTPITYKVDYASTGTPMSADVDVTVERA